MSNLNKERKPPRNWPEYKAMSRHGTLVPFYCLTWAADWAAFYLGKWPMVELLQYLGSFSIIFAAVLYFAGASDRLKQKHYAAWQVINTAEGKGGNGGRIDALQELNHDHIALIGVNVASAYLEGLDPESAHARRANFSAADLRGANFRNADLEDADFHFANLRGAGLQDCKLAGALLDDADLVGANLSGADLAGISLERADLRNADLSKVRNWQSIKLVTQANILGIRNPPEGFVTWARKNGAIEVQIDEAKSK